MIAAHAMLEDGGLEEARRDRYAGWDTDAAKALLRDATLESCAETVTAQGINPAPRSGRQERLENLVNRFL
jgi:xylose isomerase